MAVTATTRLPAGWYPDPEGGNRRRWWDGREWTQYTADFLRPTSVDEVEIETPATGKAKRKTGKARVTFIELKQAKPQKASRATKAPQKVVTEATDAPAEAHSPAERIGRFLAGAAYALPAIRRSRKRRRAHRSTK